MATLCIWHGYLLTATGSNIYTLNLVESWLADGHDVVLVCQERTPEDFSFIDREVVLSMREADADPEQTPIQVVAGDRSFTERGQCTLVRPDIDDLLPVYVVDRYEGFDVRRIIDIDDDQRSRFAICQQAALRWVAAEWSLDGVLINHAVPLPPALSDELRALGIPHAIKVHGSELEYAIDADSSWVQPAQKGLAGANAILVGSNHIADRTAELLGADCLQGRVHIVPPGVDIDRFTPLSSRRGESRFGKVISNFRSELVATVAGKVMQQPDGRGTDQQHRISSIVSTHDDDPDALQDALAIADSYEERHIDRDLMHRIADASLGNHPTVSFVGKLIPQKGVHLVVAAMPLVLQRNPDARLVIAGFGPLRELLELFVHACSAGHRDLALRAGQNIVAQLSSRDTSVVESSFADLFDDGDLDQAYWKAARQLGTQTTFTGLIDHDVLPLLWPLCEVSIVPSLLAEAFGMVAAEAASCGSVPIVANHSGLADAADIIDGSLSAPAPDVEPMRFEVHSHGAVSRLADVILTRLELSDSESAEQARQARAHVVGSLSWVALSRKVAHLMSATRA